MSSLGVRIADMPDLGAVSDACSIVGEHAGSGLFTTLALRDYIGGPSTAMRPVITAASLTLALRALSSPVFGDFGVPAFGLGITGNQNCIIGQVINDLPTNTLAFPTGVTGYAKITTSGNQAFGVFGRCDLSTVGVHGTAIGAEFNAFNFGGDPNGTFPPNAGIGTDDFVTIAMQVASYGNFPAKIGVGVMYGGVPAGGQPFKVGFYANPGASQLYSMLLDATGSVGPANGGALIRSTGTEPNLILQTQSLPAAGNAVLTVIDHVGGVQAVINQAGDFVSTGISIGHDGTINYLTAATSATATAGASTLPANPLGFLIQKLAGTNIKIPYYSV